MQTFTANSAAFAKALNSIIAVVSTKPLVPAAECCLLIVTGAVAGDGAKMRLFATNYESTISASCAINATENFQVLVPARHLLDTLRGLADQPVKFSSHPDTFAFEIKANSSKYRLAGMDPATFPKPERIAKPALTLTVAESILHEGIKTALATTLAAGVEMRGIQPEFESVCVEVDEKALHLVGADGPRITVYEKPRLTNPDGDAAYTATLPKDTERAELLIPRAAAQHLLSVLNPKSDEPVTLTSNGTHARLLDTRWFSRLTEGKYPDYRRVFHPESQNFLRVNAPELLAAVKRLDKYAPMQDRSIVFSLSPEHPLTLSTQSYDGSHEGRETVPCEYEGAAMQIAFRGPEIAGLLALWPQGEIEVAMGEPNRTAQLRQWETQSGHEAYSTIACLQSPLVTPAMIAA